MKRSKIDKIREQVARLYAASGCSCCRDDEGWAAASSALGRLLDIPTYPDDSGFNFYEVAREYDAKEPTP